MKTHILIDTANVFKRAQFSTHGDLSDKVGLSLHTLLSSIRKAWRDFQGDHVVFCYEGRSWRKDFYLPYKRNRSEIRANFTTKEAEEEQVFWETFDQFKEFSIEKTNATVLHHPQLEGDDLIGGWIQYHPNDNHVIISTDGDFAQLIAPNVKIYNGVEEMTITHEGYFDAKGRPIEDKKTGTLKKAPDPEWMLFMKCMRGDKNDNVFSAYPGVREKGTKNKVGLREAYEDRITKGYSWNNLMLQRWMDHEGVEHKVLDDYVRNVILCDLSAQPEYVRNFIKETIETEINKNKHIQQVGVRLLKFCAQYDLERISKQIESYAEPLNSRYNTCQQ